MASRPGQPDTCLRPPVRRGFTLIEMSISLAILSMLLVAIGSAIMLAAKTLPQGSNASSETSTAAMTIEDIASELQFALDFNERSATEVEFTVADRDGDGIRETIRYVLDGVDLERHYNGGSGLDVLEDVEEFELVYETTVRTETIPTTIANDEVEIATHSSETVVQDHITTPSNWIGQYFLPTSLPADTIDWTVTRGLVRARREGSATGMTKVQLIVPDAGNLPTTTIVDQVIMVETLLGAAYEWEEYTFGNAVAFPPSQGLCLVLEFSSGGDASAISYDTGAILSGRVETTDGGTSWVAQPESMHYYVYGTYTTPGPPLDVDHTYLTGIRIKLRTGAETATLVQTSTPLLHVKEITP